MKNYNKNLKLIFFSIILSLIFSLTTSASIISLNPKILTDAPPLNQTLIIRDTNSTTELPNRFRIIKELNISGSAEFKPLQLENLIKAINNKNLYIVDLRQESHGFINTVPISFYNRETLLTKGLTTTQAIDAEKIALDSIKLGSEVNIYNKHGELLETISCEKVFSEETLANENKVKYKRLAVRDGSIPTPEVTDDFVLFVKSKPSDSHLHFHCLEGQGRTTTFMSLYQMMNNNVKLPLDAILKQQLDAGGIILTDSVKRAEFLESFYNYTLANMDSNFNTPYSTWLNSH